MLALFVLYFCGNSYHFFSLQAFPGPQARLSSIMHLKPEPTESKSAKTIKLMAMIKKTNPFLAIGFTSYERRHSVLLRAESGGIDKQMVGRTYGQLDGRTDVCTDFPCSVFYRTSLPPKKNLSWDKK